MKGLFGDECKQTVNWLLYGLFNGNFWVLALYLRQQHIQKHTHTRTHNEIKFLNNQTNCCTFFFLLQSTRVVLFLFLLLSIMVYYGHTMEINLTLCNLWAVVTLCVCDEWKLKCRITMAIWNILFVENLYIKMNNLMEYYNESRLCLLIYNRK